jgi:hypothetical protein
LSLDLALPESPDRHYKKEQTFETSNTYWDYYMAQTVGFLVPRPQ